MFGLLDVSLRKWSLVNLFSKEIPISIKFLKFLQQEELPKSKTGQVFLSCLILKARELISFPRFQKKAFSELIPGIDPDQEELLECMLQLNP